VIGNATGKAIVEYASSPIIAASFNEAVVLARFGLLFLSGLLIRLELFPGFL